jgi:Zn-dependent protease with chaperone function
MPVLPKIPQHVHAFVLVLIYILTSVFLLLIIVFLWGLPVTDLVFVFIVVGWCGFCWSASCWQPFLTLSKRKVRYPTLAEETPVKKLIAEIQSACLEKKGRKVLRICLRIEETDACTAYVIGWSTLVLSKGIIEAFSKAELSGVIAHEYGHLYSRDTIAGAAFFTAHRLHQGYPYVRLYLKKFFLILRWRSSMLVAVMGVCWILVKRFPFLSLSATLLYLANVRYIDQLFDWFWAANNRFIEYERDLFAHELGYGRGLRDALVRSLARVNSQLHGLSSQNKPILLFITGSED